MNDILPNARSTACFSVDVIRCPVCGGKTSFAEGRLSCPLGHVAQKTDYGWCWGRWKAQNGDARWKTLLKSAFDPLVNPYSPLVQLSRKRIEAYYARALNDRGLAEQWSTHFLGGLDLPAVPTLLDHGCGRGRVAALARQCGFRTFGQEIAPHPWWGKLDGTLFQVVSPTLDYLPWGNEVADIVTDFSVIGHFLPHSLSGLAVEVFRVLKPGGYWVIWEANDLGYGTHVNRRHYGRLHALNDVLGIVAHSGFEMHSSWFESFNFPIFPRVESFVRNVLFSRDFDYFDYNQGVAQYINPERRAKWVLRLRKPV